MGPDKEIAMAAAISDVHNGMLQKDAAAKWGVAPSTLSTRLHGAHSHQEAHQHQQKLSPIQEEDLVEWILEEEDSGRSPYRCEIRRMAELIYQANGGTDSIGVNWVDGFIHRHSKLKAKLQASLEASRASLTLPTRIREFQRRLERVRREKKIPIHNIVNMDEVGVREGETKEGKVVGTVLTRRGPRKISEATEWATIIEAMTADGRRLTPVVIFKGENLQGQWLPSPFPLWKFDATDSGWSNAKIALKWLKQVYLPETRPSKSGQWRLLILDQHTTHVTAEFMYECMVHNVRCLYIPSHSSHIMQPLDLGIFSALKEYYHQATMGFGFYAASGPYNKQRFIKAYEQASKKAFSDRNIHTGFRISGIEPFDPDRPFRNPKMVGKLHDIEPEEPVLPYDLSDIILVTPQKGLDVRDQLLELQKTEAPIHRDLRLLFGKVEKALDQKSFEVANLRNQNQNLEQQLEALEPQGRVAVQSDPNDTFPDAIQIYEAQVAAYRAAHDYEAKHRKELKKTATELYNNTIEPYLNEWQIQ